MVSSFDGVVVGYDGSDHAALALRWAAEAAQRSGQQLMVLHALQLEHVPHFAPTSTSAWVREAQTGAKPVQQVGAELAAEVLGPGRVRSATALGSPSARLVEASEHARLVVTGSRGRGTVAAGLLGSTAYAVTAHAHCPVVVVRAPAGAQAPPRPGPDRPVVVGIDDLGVSGHALDAAALAASDAGAPLRLVRARSVTPVESWGFTLGTFTQAELVEAVEEHAESVLAAATARVREAYPALAVEGHAVDGEAGRALAAEATGAGLIVVGSRGRGGFAGLLLGSVSHRVIHEAVCPVMVVR